MFIINKLRNYININPTARKFFVSLLSPFTVPLLFLQNYLSIKGYRRRKSILEWKKKNPKNILYYKSGVAFNISTKKNSISKYLVFQKDNEFNETKLDYRGNTAYATMMTKLCGFNPRREFIVKIIGDLMKENPEQQIIVLGHYKNLLTYLYKAIDHKNIGTVGYYVGGMKQEALKESEEKQIIIATYSMASEALDIKSLTTLVMATPKTDVTQSIGRILRTKHTKPMVIDVVDQHQVFKRQCNKRIKYYNKQGYKIKRCSNKNYNEFTEIITKKKKGTKTTIEISDNPLKGKCLINLSSS